MNPVPSGVLIELLAPGFRWAMPGHWGKWKTFFNTEGRLTQKHPAAAAAQVGTAARSGAVGANCSLMDTGQAVPPQAAG